ncbi:hypothetical protein Q3G72_001471 [Acer saccharum]|nr:hypothetical protein Q3G72_001471 [Acer saccharum]
MDQLNPFMLMDKVEVFYESHMSSSTIGSKESKEEISSLVNGIPSHSYQVPTTLPEVEPGIAGDGLPPKTPKNTKGRRNRNSTNCHSMRTRNSKVSEVRGEQATKTDEEEKWRLQGWKSGGGSNRQSRRVVSGCGGGKGYGNMEDSWV